MTNSEARNPRRWVRRLRRGFVVTLFAIVLLGAGLVLNSLRMPSRQMQVTPVSDIAVDDERVAEILAEFLAVPSNSYEDRSRMEPERFRELHAILERRFPNTHRVLERELVGELSLLYCWHGRDESLEPILLMAHLDVVPVEDSLETPWRHPHGTIVDGFVWGRGALDVKCGVVGIMAAMEHLAESGFVPERTVYLAFGHDEEVGGEQGNATIARLLAKRGVRLACVLDEGGAVLDGVIAGVPRPVAFVAIAEKRVARLGITARGEGGHGSMPGRTAVLNLAEAIVRIDARPRPIRLTAGTETLLDFLGPEMPLLQRTVMGNRWLFRGFLGRQFAASPSTNAVARTTLNPTQLRTESAAGQSAAVARATFDVRMLPGDTIESVREHVLRSTADLTCCGVPAITCEIAADYPGVAVSPVDSREFLALQRSIHEVLPDVIVAAGQTSVATDSRWYGELSDNIYRFIPMRLRPTDVVRIHGRDERISIENLGEITRFYVQFVRNTAS